MDKKGQRQWARRQYQQSAVGLQGQSAIHSVFLITLFVHVSDWWFGFQRDSLFGTYFWVWLFTGILMWLILNARQRGMNWPILAQTMILSMLAYSVPLFVGVLEIALPHALANGLIIFAPVWSLYLFFTGQIQGIWRILFVLYMVFWMILAITFLSKQEVLQYELKDRFVDVRAPITATWDMIKDTSVAAVDGFKAFVWKYNQSKTDYLMYATGQDLYTAEVDEHAEEKLGVFFENIEKSQKDYVRDDAVSVWATILARTFDEPMTIHFNCIGDKGKDSVVKPDRMIPSQPYIVEVKDDRDLDCSFDRGVFDWGSHRVYLYANFTFQTMAYKKTYFVDRNRALALAREDIDIMDYYGVSDENPKAVYTAGPVMIGMDIRPSPLKLDRSSSNPINPTLGVSVKNEWEGRIINVTDFELILPPFAELQDSKCGSDWEFTQAEPGRYVLQTNFGPIKLYQSLRCPIIIHPGFYDDVLGDTPIATHSFKATARYYYELEESISFTVKKTQADEEWIQHTKTSKPQFQIDNFRLDYGDQRIIDLWERVEDNETLDKDLMFRIKSQTDPVSAKCVMREKHFLVCTAGIPSEEKPSLKATLVTIEVDDMYNKVDECFTIAAGDYPLPLDTETDAKCNGWHDPARIKKRAGTSGTSGLGCTSLVSCDGKVSKAWYPGSDETEFPDRKCVSLCEWYSLCDYFEGSWSCSCSAEDCRKNEELCKEICPTGANCCPDKICCTGFSSSATPSSTEDPCCEGCTCKDPEVCNSCKSCYYDWPIYFCRSNS
jgi:hypothetical protein